LKKNKGQAKVLLRGAEDLVQIQRKSQCTKPENHNQKLAKKIKAPSKKIEKNKGCEAKTLKKIKGAMKRRNENASDHRSTLVTVAMNWSN
jgi:hypothetical protein